MSPHSRVSVPGCVCLREGSSIDSLVVNPEYFQKCDTVAFSLVLNADCQLSLLSTRDDHMVHRTPLVSSVSLGTP